MTNTSIPQVKIVNVETGEEVIRDANAQEIANFEQNAINAQAEKAAEAQKAADRSALLTQLGITEEQAKLLLG
jgi:uncharacterized lipoprotein